MGCGGSSEPPDERISEQEIYEAFRAMDIDGSGTISAEELREVVKRLGEDLTEDDIQEMVELVDENGDGEIDYGEFVKIMRS
ncbi:uncharacterized protein LOC100369336 [Saccoglossus kowalevskii]|uniref:Calmodulin-like n=1 Tax=Saccoglossus kowalevskii TaxID=10224 RepID=A0ABM0GUF5_SACKO|nr:PREDICTED: calmodulin-like [Saccoglossus kowalevskii]